MQRYSVFKRGTSTKELCDRLRALRVSGVSVLPLSGIVFADMTDGKAEELVKKGFLVKLVYPMYASDHPMLWAQQVTAPPEPPFDPTQPQISGLDSLGLSRFLQLAQALDPPIDGSGIGFNIAIVDSGIRETHVGLKNKVIYSKNFSGALSGVTDVFDHGTGVAWLAAGGTRPSDEPQGFAPGSKLLNIKVLGDNGMGSSELTLLGLEDIAKILLEHPDDEDQMRPKIINMSLGSLDIGDPADPVRVAIASILARETIADRVIPAVIAAAGNTGPVAGSILTPAADPLVAAVGAVDTDFQVPEWSSRGPTKEGTVKPDVTFFGVNLVTASAKGDTAVRTVSGSSFSCAQMSGGAAVVAEFISRTLGTRVYTEHIEQLPEFTVKPEGAPSGKDNAWGWGIPFGDVILSHYGYVQAMDIAGVAMPLAVLAMLGGLVKNFATQWKKRA